jgi:hypothetical protein
MRRGYAPAADLRMRVTSSSHQALLTPPTTAPTTAPTTGFDIACAYSTTGTTVTVLLSASTHPHSDEGPEEP